MRNFSKIKKTYECFDDWRDIISRGLTLEGLITSYFIRNPGGYDTLMQMARWFGYRVSKGKSYEEAHRL